MRDPRKCSIKGCGGVPVGLPQVQVWAVGCKAGDHPPALATSNLPHCAEHMAEVIADPQRFMTDLEMRPLITDALRVTGRKYADFNTARIVSVPLAEMLDFTDAAGRA